MVWVMGILVVVVVLAQLFIRLAPTDPLRWHVAPEVTEDRNLPGGVKRVIAAWSDDYVRLDKIISGSPRTRRIAGGPRADMTTYVTRSLVWGFPDYTTVARSGDQIQIHARARFGRSDMGVNRRRVEGWIAALRGE